MKSPFWVSFHTEMVAAPGLKGTKGTKGIPGFGTFGSAAFAAAAFGVAAFGVAAFGAATLFFKSWVLTGLPPRAGAANWQLKRSKTRATIAFVPSKLAEVLEFCTGVTYS
ncbi:MAG TPA: hypothetical protein PKN86_16955 [Candidatus Obscuribacter sp.]|nr:hypothetical protein [Candidatus Obscuribacter sp.]MBK9279661.1 hypothetical protein [Candidatus Obscuribacter sp.]HNM51410.1 hypothetical protein [Candidatus Obscuribacter sp.]